MLFYVRYKSLEKTFHSYKNWSLMQLGYYSITCNLTTLNKIFRERGVRWNVYVWDKGTCQKWKNTTSRNVFRGILAAFQAHRNELLGKPP